MKKIMRQMIPFITFELPLKYEYIEQLFIKIHQDEEQRYSNWSTSASLKKVASYYWYYYVLLHFSFLFGSATLFNCLAAIFRNDYASLHFIVYYFGFLITFPILLITRYMPIFYSDFLPKLQTIAFTYDSKHLAQLEKCKQAQYSNLALVLIFYVVNKTGEINALNSIDALSKLLMKVYGVDNGSLKKNLELIHTKSNHLSPRKLKEVEKGFQEAFSFFEDLHYEKGISLLRALEMKIKIK